MNQKVHIRHHDTAKPLVFPERQAAAYVTQAETGFKPAPQSAPIGFDSHLAKATYNKTRAAGHLRSQLSEGTHLPKHPTSPSHICLMQCQHMHGERLMQDHPSEMKSGSFRMMWIEFFTSQSWSSCGRCRNTELQTLLQHTILIL